MTKKFGAQTTENVERSGDRLGGGRTVLDAGIYRGATVKAAYTGKSQSSNADSITVIMDVNGTEVSSTYWVTNKDGKNTYQTKAGKDALLGGYDDMDQFSLLAGGVPLNEADFEDKVIKIYDFEKRADVEVSRPTMVDCIGEKLTVAIQRTKLNKREKVGDEYVNKAETYEINEIVKFFQDETDLTVEEIKAGLEKADFVHRWEEKFAGQVNDKSVEVSGKPGAPTGGAPQAKSASVTGMFKKK